MSPVVVEEITYFHYLALQSVTIRYFKKLCYLSPRCSVWKILCSLTQWTDIPTGWPILASPRPFWVIWLDTHTSPMWGSINVGSCLSQSWGKYGSITCGWLSLQPLSIYIVFIPSLSQMWGHSTSIPDYLLYAHYYILGHVEKYSVDVDYLYRGVNKYINFARRHGFCKRSHFESVNIWCSRKYIYIFPQKL